MFEAARLWEDDPCGPSDRRARAALRPRRLFLPRPVARDPRFRRARPARLGPAKSADLVRQGPVCVRPRGIRRAAPRRSASRARRSRAIPRTPGRCMRSPMSSRWTAGRSEGIAFLEILAPALARRAFHGGPQRLASRALSDRGGRFDEVLADFDHHAAPKLADARRLTASTPPRCCGGWNSPGSMSARAGGRSRANGRRMSTTMCSRSTTCISRSPRRARPTPAMSRALRQARSTTTRASARRQSRVHRRGRAPADRRRDRFRRRRLSRRRGRDPAGARDEAIRIGGSHAQRDIVDLTLIAAAERAGQTSPCAFAARGARRGSADGANEGGLRAVLR